MNHDNPNLIITGIGGNAPLEAEGTIHGFPFYMRLRSSSTIWIAHRGKDPVDVGSTYEHDQGWMICLEPLVAGMDLKTVKELTRGTGTGYYTGWLTPKEALVLLHQGIAAWENDPHAYRFPPPAPTESLADCIHTELPKPWEK